MKRFPLPQKFRIWLTVCGLIGLHFCLGWSALRHAAPTADEYSYISTAYLYVKTGDFRLDRTHPPLIRLIIGIPIQCIHVTLPPLQQEKWNLPESQVLGYVIGWEMLLGSENNWRQLLTLARVPILTLSCGLAVLLFIWADRLYGKNGAFITLFLYTFSPNMLAHASLATMDLGICFFMTASLFAVYLYLNKPKQWKLIIAGGVLGLALAAKVTAMLVVLPIVISILYAEINQVNNSANIPVQRLFIKFAVFFGCAFISLLLVYGFPLKPFYYFETLSHVLYKSTQAGGDPVPGMPHLNHAFYLLGDYSTSGWFYYYAAAFLCKTPLAVFGLFIMILIWHHNRWNGLADTLITGTILTLFLVSMANRVNIGLRHILPIYPLLFLYAGRVALFESRTLRGLFVPLLLLWYVIASIWICPNYLAYFNEAVGGPANAVHLLDDSNIDWGQDLAALKAVQEQYPDEPLYVATNWMFNPAAFGIQAAMLQNEQIQNPPDGIVAVGIHWAVRNRIHQRSPYYFHWIETYQPAGHVGHSVLIYQFE